MPALGLGSLRRYCSRRRGGLGYEPPGQKQAQSGNGFMTFKWDEQKSERPVSAQMLFRIQTPKLPALTAVEHLELLGGVCVWIRTTPCDSWKVPQACGWTIFLVPFDDP